MNPDFLVIGAGVVGLTTALCARQAGYEVVVVAERFAPDITSVVAGALWEWPPAVCGHHRDEHAHDGCSHTLEERVPGGSLFSRCRCTSYEGNPQSD